MKPMIPTLLLLAMGSAQAAVPIAMEDQSQLNVPGLQLRRSSCRPLKTRCPTTPLARWCARAMPCSSIHAG